MTPPTLARCLAICSAALALSVISSQAEIKVVSELNDSAHENPKFTFQYSPSPSANDAGTKAKFSLVDGALDEGSGDVDLLNDGQIPTGSDKPDENVFFRQGTDGGRVVADLGSAIAIQQINSYSWHPGSRAPQVYSLYASDGSTTNFTKRPKRDVAPEKCGWSLITKVDTRTEHGLNGGQYVVTISNSSEVIGKYRYLLFDFQRTETNDNFGNTFYSEIDIVDRNAKEPPQPAIGTVPVTNISRIFTTSDGKYQITIDPSRAPDLSDWAFKELAPMTQEWYPRLVKMLPSDGYEAPTKLTIEFGKTAPGNPAVTRGTRITVGSSWLRQNLQGEGKGCVVHEMVHVVQHYRGGSPPGWLVEGIPDYIRWFIYEPEKHGANIRPKAVAKARYDNSYRVTANFLNWVTEKYDKELVLQLNAALRSRTYSPELWTKLTTYTVEELGDEWKKSLPTESKTE